MGEKIRTNSSLLIAILELSLFSTIAPTYAISGTVASSAMNRLEEMPMPETPYTTYNTILETQKYLFYGGLQKIYNWTGSEWVSIRDSQNTAGWKALRAFKEGQWIYASGTGPGGSIIYSKDYGVTWNCGLLNVLQTGMYELANGSIVASPWGMIGGVMYISNNLVNWLELFNATRFYIESGGTLSAEVPHSTLGYSLEYNLLFIDYEPYLVGGGSNHTIMRQNVTSGQWAIMTSKQTGRNNKNTAFFQVASTPERIFFSTSDGDYFDLKAANPTETQWYDTDSFRLFGKRHNWLCEDFNMAYKNGVLYIGERVRLNDARNAEFTYGIYVSSDYGVHWGKLIERKGQYTGEDKVVKFQFFKGEKNLYIEDLGNGRLYRMPYLTQSEAWHIIKQQTTTRNENTITQILELGNYTDDVIDLSGYGIKPYANLSFIGRSYFNWQGANSGFEWGNKTTWQGDIARSYVTSADKHSGTYSLNITYSVTEPLWIETQYINSGYGVNSTPWQVSGYVKAKASAYQMSIYVNLRNSTSGSRLTYINTEAFTISTSWKRYNITVPYTKNGYDQVFAQFRFSIPDTGGWFLLDDVLVERVAKGAPPSNKKLLNAFTDGDYFTSELRTQNPTVTINGQTFAYNGTLDNNEETTPQTLILPKAGIIPISSISVGGSGIVKLKIQALVDAIQSSIYTDSECTRPVSHVDWGVVFIDRWTYKDFFIRNEIVGTGELWAGATLRVSNVNPKTALPYLHMEWNISGPITHDGITWADMFPLENWIARPFRLWQKFDTTLPPEITSFEFDIDITAYLMGDANYDGIVDAYDLQIIGAQYSSTKIYPMETDSYDMEWNWYNPAFANYYDKDLLELRGGTTSDLMCNLLDLTWIGKNWHSKA